MLSYEIGQLVPGEGVYIGKYTNKSLSQTFNIFAAPEDLQDNGRRSLLGYHGTQALLARNKDWHGHDGGNYKNDTELYQALRDGSYQGEWFIPPRELLNGKDDQGNMTQPDNIVAHADKGALKGTFWGASTGRGFPECYFSSTERRIMEFSYVYKDMIMRRGWESCVPKDSASSCRPVRLTPVND